MMEVLLARIRNGGRQAMAAQPPRTALRAPFFALWVVIAPMCMIDKARPWVVSPAILATVSLWSSDNKGPSPDVPATQNP